MKRKCTLFMVMLLAFTLLISTTSISVSAETTTYTPIGGSAEFVKNLVVDSDANIPDLTFTYTIKRGDYQAATADTVEILEGIGANIGVAQFTNSDTANTIPGLPDDADPTNPTEGKKYAQETVSITFPQTSFTKPGVYRYIITELSTPVLPGVTYDANPTLP